MRNLWQLIQEAGYPDLAVAGLAKNAGKTVTFNYLVKEACKEKLTLGLTSLGRDGELWDAITFKNKPAIEVPPGTVIATAKKVMGNGTAKLETIVGTGVDTPLGEIVLARVQTGGTVQLAGPSRVHQLIKIIVQLKNNGAQLVLVDGALDRQSFAAPRVTGACVLATGANVGESLQQAVDITRQRVRQFLLPPAGSECEKLYSPGKVSIVTGKGEIVTFPNYLAITMEKEFWRMGDSVSHVIFSGCLLQSTLTNILESGIGLNELTLIVRDATCLFADGASSDTFLNAGGKIEALNPIRLLALTINPTAPFDKSFNARVFHREMSDAIPEVPVFDLVQGLGPDMDGAGVI